MRDAMRTGRIGIAVILTVLLLVLAGCDGGGGNATPASESTFHAIEVGRIGGHHRVLRLEAPRECFLASTTYNNYEIWVPVDWDICLYGEGW